MGGGRPRRGRPRTGDLAEAASALEPSRAPAPEALLALQLGTGRIAVEQLRQALEQAARPVVKCYWFDLYAMSAEVALALWLERHGRARATPGRRAMATEAVGHLGRFARVFPIGRLAGPAPPGPGSPGPDGWAPRARRDWRPPWPPPSGSTCCTSRPWPSTSWDGHGGAGAAPGRPGAGRVPVRADRGP